jgi:hypothetical protein
VDVSGKDIPEKRVVKEETPHARNGGGVSVKIDKFSD